MKLTNFPPVYYISLEESIDRQENLNKEFSNWGITNYTASISKRFAECNDVIHGSLVHTLNSSNKGASTSHLKNIKKWLTETNEPYAVFFEDDVSFQTVQYWPFWWENFFEQLPDDWDAVQLMWVRPHMVKVEFRKRYPDDWSATAFMLKREYGQRLVDQFMISDNEFNYEMGTLQPIVENVLFASGTVYTVPLFIEETNLPTTFINAPEFDDSLIVNGQGESHHSSQESVLNWWKTIGKDTSIKRLMGNNVFDHTFDWGDFSIELQQSIKKEIGKENLYERFFRVEPNDVVVDIGASVGPFTYSILNKKPKEVYCIEPSKELFPALVTNTSKYTKTTPIIYINKAITEVNEEVKVFSKNNQNIYGGIDDYKSLTFKEFIKTHNIQKIDFLKLDCEGGEYSIFNEENIDWILNNVNKIAAEFHLTYAGCKEKFRYFRDNYLQRFKHYVVMSNGTQNIHNGFELNLTKWIFDDLFFDNYYGELMVYLYK